MVPRRTQDRRAAEATGKWLIASCREHNKLEVSHEFLDQIFNLTDGRHVYLRNADAGQHHPGWRAR